MKNAIIFLIFLTISFGCSTQKVQEIDFEKIDGFNAPEIIVPVKKIVMNELVINVEKKENQKKS